jgi:Family of unknown function (DUF6338)
LRSSVRSRTSATRWRSSARNCRTAGGAIHAFGNKSAINGLRPRPAQVRHLGGGWYGRRSRASAYPNPPDLYLESAYVMGNDGSFGPRVQATGGVYVNMTDVEVLEFVEVAHTEPEIADGPG